MSIFDQANAKRFQIKNPNFNGTYTIGRSGTVRASIAFPDGESRDLTYLNEETARQGLQKLSRYKVEFLKETQNSSNLNDRVAQAKADMIAKGHGRPGLGERPRTLPVAESASQEFSQEQLGILKASVFQAFCKVHGPEGDCAYLPTDFNNAIIKRAMDDSDALWIDENFVIMANWLYEHNMLHDGKRGTVITPYRSPDDVIADAQHQQKNEDTERALKLRTQPLEKIREAVKSEYPNLDLGGRKSFTESHGSGEVAEEIKAARQLSTEELAAIESQRRASRRQSSPRKYDW
jgi:hypothetical protein